MLVADLIRRHEPDLIGLQEAELYQARDLIKLLGEYDWIGVGRDDGKEQGEATAILFRKSRFELVSGQTFWLSPTPSSVGKGWDAALNRTISIARLRDQCQRQGAVSVQHPFRSRGAGRPKWRAASWWWN